MESVFELMERMRQDESNLVYFPDTSARHGEAYLEAMVDNTLKRTPIPYKLAERAIDVLWEWGTASNGADDEGALYFYLHTPDQKFITQSNRLV